MIDMLLEYLLKTPAIPKNIRYGILQFFEINRQFLSGFYVGAFEFNEKRYGLARYSFGSNMAAILSTFNLYFIRQTVLKYSLVLCKSKQSAILYSVF